MQDNNRFFQFVWRLNALAIAGLVLLTVLLGLYGLTSLVSWETRERNVTDLVTVNPGVSQQEEVRLGYPSSIAGTQIVRIPLYLEQKTDVTYFSKSSGANTVNDLYVDSATGKSNWLFKGTHRLIFNQNPILRQLKSNESVVTSILYSLIEKDSNGDGRLSHKDEITVGYSSPDGSIYKPLMNNIEKLYATEQVSDDRFIIVYSRNGESRVATYALPAYTIVADNALPKLSAAP
jgi:hypothetical protein